MANRILEKVDPVLDLPLVDLKALRFPPEPVRSPGALVANTAIRRKDEAEDDGEEPNPLIDFFAGSPAASATTSAPRPRTVRSRERRSGHGFVRSQASAAVSAMPSWNRGAVISRPNGTPSGVTPPGR